MRFVRCIARFISLAFFALISPIHAQSINISNFYYRDYLDFGQNKGVFKESAESSNGLEITGKNGEKLKIPHIPTFQASSNYGSLTSIGRGFAVTANHVSNVSDAEKMRDFGLSVYTIANESVTTASGEITGISKPYGRDEKFVRLSKYVIEGQAEMLNIAESIEQGSSEKNTKENEFNDEMKKLAQDKKVYIFQAGSGIMKFRDTNNSIGVVNLSDDGSMRGGGFGVIAFGETGTSKYGEYYTLITGYGAGNSQGIMFYYNANGDFNNRITTGDSGSGVYAYDSKNNKWILLGVVSRNTHDTELNSVKNQAEVAFVSQKDLEDYRQNFEQKINLVVTESGKNNWQLTNQKIENNPRGDTPQQEYTLTQNKDLIFSGGGNIEVTQDITRNQSGYAGGFVFEKPSSGTATYTFKNKNGGNYSFKGSGLDIGENVVVEWALKNPNKDESLHKVGKGELKIKTQNNSDTNLGTLKIGEGKVTLDTDKRAYDNIYITSGRGELALIKDKAEALGATKNNGAQGRSGVSNATSYTLTQSKNSAMGFYFGTGGGKLDLGGNSLTLNTIAANDKNAIVTNSNGNATLTIEGKEYETSGNKGSKKANTIIHATIGDTNANIDINYSGDKSATNSPSTRNVVILSDSEESKNKSVDSVDSSVASLPQNDKKISNHNDNVGASLIFDGNINTKGKMEVINGNVALQGHATAHATISDKSLIEKIKTAESGTQKEMPSYMDLEKPSHLEQPDWDNRAFKFGTSGITLTNSNLTLGRNSTLESDITASNNSTIRFGGDVTHFIDNKDGKNVTGSGFRYQQEVQSGTIGETQEQIANQTISYKGKISANGGTINSSIWDFNASLDLKDSAKLTADYLTLGKDSTVKLESSANASVKTLKLQSVSESDLSTIFTNGTSGNSKLKVTESFWFDSVNSLNLDKLESANIDKTQNYDIVGVKSTITGTSKDLSANVNLFEGANLTIQSLTLKDTAQNASTSSLRTSEASVAIQNGESGLPRRAVGSSRNDDSTKIKNRVYLGNDSSDSTSGATKLTLTNNLKAENLDSAIIELRGKSEIQTPKIEFSSVKDGRLILESGSKLSGANSGTSANVEIKGTDSKLGIYVGGTQSFDINASGGSSVVLSSLRASETSVANHLENNAESSSGLPRTLASARNDDLDSAIQNNKFSGKITAKDSSVVASDLETITASVDLQGSAKLTAKNIELTNGFDSIKLQGSANLTADKISANNATTLNFTQENGAKFDVKNITLTNSTLKASTLTLNAESSIITSDSTSKLEITNLKVTNGNLTLDLADSAKNAEKLTAIDISNGGSVSFAKKWDFGSATNFTSNGGSGKINFKDATYTQNGNAKTISADSTISGALQLSSVGKENTQKARNANPQNSTNRFETLKFSDKTLTLGESSTISVTFDNSISKSGYSTAGITLGQYYTLISASGITDNRTNKIITFNFSDSSDALFVVGKFFDGKELKIKFTESDPRDFSELIKHINPRYSEVLKALTEAYPQDSAIELSANTDDYAVLESRVRGIDEAMNSIAQGNASRLMQNLLFSNDYTINTRVLQVRLARATQGKMPLRFAQSGTLYRLQKLKGDVVASDAMPSYRVESDSASGIELPNSAWLNVGGGYFGGSAQMGFGATNIGYDRIFSANGGDVMIGAMMGFGGSKGIKGGLSESAIFYNFGLYIDSVFDARSGAFGGHELQSNLNFSVSENHKNFVGDSDAHESHNQNAWSAKNSAFGTLLTLYYKYNFIVASSEKISHALKPIALLAVGYNRNGAFASAEYKQGAFGSASVAYGLGVEYNAVMSDSFYSISTVLKDIVWSGNKRVDVGLNGARNFISYTLETAPRFGVELNLVGSHKVFEMGENGSLYVQYGITGMVDMGANYGIKGDIKMGWRF